MAKINIGTEINLEDLLQSRLLIQANSGGGKSVLARVIIEETFGKVPFIVMDIEGEYYTLKEKYGDVLVIGGQHADIPISLKSVKLLPKEIIANRLSVVIDLSDLQMNDRILYSKHFIETMMDLPKDYWINYLVFIEEAHKLCGEQDKQASATAVKDLMSRGRKRGYCGVLLTQRISKLHKDAAAECNNKFIGRTYLDIDLDRAAKELGISAATEKLKIRDLQPGNFFAFGTAIFPHHVHSVKIKQPETKIPKAGVDLNIKPKAPTEKIKSMLAKLNDLPAEAEKELKTVQELQKEVTRLKKELSAMPKPAADEVWVKGLKQEIIDKNRIISQKDNIILQLQKNIDGARQWLSKEVDTISPSLQKYEKPRVDIPVKTSTHQPAPVRNVNTSSSGTVTGGAMRMLKAAAMFHPKPITRTRMAALAGLSHTSGSFGTYRSTLKKEGLLIENGNEYSITPKGLEKAGNVATLPTDPHALIEMWCDNVGSNSGAARILRVLGEKYPESLSKSAIGDLVGMSSTSGSFGTYLSILKRNGLITVNGQNVKASDELFE